MDWSNTNATLMSWPKHSALTTIRQEGIKTAVAAIQNQAEILRAALQSSSDKVCCNNAPSSKVCLDMNSQSSLKKKILRLTLEIIYANVSKGLTKMRMAHTIAFMQKECQILKMLKKWMV